MTEMQKVISLLKEILETREDSLGKAYCLEILENDYGLKSCGIQIYFSDEEEIAGINLGE